VSFRKWVLRAAVGVMKEAARKRGARHREHVEREPARDAFAHRPADHAARIQVDDSCQIQPPSAVGTYVMSVTQASFGASGA
jgi:hypothetical protein